jgi:ABC-type lipoprotein release transport system permease subunit
MAATVFAVVLVVFFVAMAAGLHEKMIEDSVRVHSGHLSISGAGYLENRTLDQFVRLDPALEALLGVDPAREGTVSTLPERVKRGQFVSDRIRRGIVLGERLARNLGADVGDEILLYSVAYSLETAYELFTVAGVMRLPEPALDRSLALISLADAQEFFVYGDRVSEIAILARDADAAPVLAASLGPALATWSGPRAEIHTWTELLPELVQFVVLDDAGMYLLLVILIVVVGFGILNTILMGVLERTREFGVLLALGVRPRAVVRLVYLESMILAIIGLAVGLAIGIPLVLYFVTHPIPLTGEAAGALELWGIEPLLTWKLKPLNPIGSTLTILGVAALAAFYPALKAGRSRPVDALRSL